MQSPCQVTRSESWETRAATYLAVILFYMSWLSSISNEIRLPKSRLPPQHIQECCHVRPTAKAQLQHQQYRSWNSGSAQQPSSSILLLLILSGRHNLLLVWLFQA